MVRISLNVAQTVLNDAKQRALLYFSMQVEILRVSIRVVRDATLMDASISLKSRD